MPGYLNEAEDYAGYSGEGAHDDPPEPERDDDAERLTTLDLYARAHVLATGLWMLIVSDLEAGRFDRIDGTRLSDACHAATLAADLSEKYGVEQRAA